MVNGVGMRVNPDFKRLMFDIGKRSNLSATSVTKIVAIQLTTNQMEIEVPRLIDSRQRNSLVKFKKVKIKQNGGLGLVDLL